MKRAPTALIVLALVAAMPAIAGWEEGVAAFRAKDYQTAYQQFTEYVQQNPGAYQGHYMLGEAALRVRKNDEALNHLRKAYDLNPNDLATKLSLGRAYTSVKRYKETATLLGSVDGNALPDNQKLAFFQLRAQARDRAGDDAGAMKDFAQLTKLKPSDATLQYKYGVMLINDGQSASGVRALKRASELDANNADIRGTYVKALLSEARNTTGDKAAKRRLYQQAAVQAKALVGLDGSFDNLMLELSAELGAGAYDSAIATGERAVAKNGSDWKASFYLGQALTSAGRFEDSEAPLKRASTLTRAAGDQRRIWKQLGYAYSKQKKYAEAVAAYEQGGDSAAAERVRANQETAEYNASVEAENAEIAKMREEAERLEKELKALEEGGGLR